MKPITKERIKRMKKTIVAALIGLALIVGVVKGHQTVNIDRPPPAVIMFSVAQSSSLVPPNYTLTNQWLAHFINVSQGCDIQIPEWTSATDAMALLTAEGFKLQIVGSSVSPYIFIRQSFAQPGAFRQGR
jgi:hypothetical protein